MDMKILRIALLPTLTTLLLALVIAIAHSLTATPLLVNAQENTLQQENVKATSTGVRASLGLLIVNTGLDSTDGTKENIEYSTPAILHNEPQDDETTAETTRDKSSENLAESQEGDAANTQSNHISQAITPEIEQGSGGVGPTSHQGPQQNEAGNRLSWLSTAGNSISQIVSDLFYSFDPHAVDPDDPYRSKNLGNTTTVVAYTVGFILLFSGIVLVSKEWLDQRLPYARHALYTQLKKIVRSTLMPRRLRNGFSALGKIAARLFS